MINLITVGIIGILVAFNAVCIREMKRKQNSRRKLKRSYRKAINALDKKEDQVRGLATDLIILKERTGIKNV